VSPGPTVTRRAALGLQCLADYRELLVISLDRGAGLDEGRGDASDPHGLKRPFGRSCRSERVRLNAAQGYAGRGQGRDD
jgi:hypothetical protein